MVDDAGYADIIGSCEVEIGKSFRCISIYIDSLICPYPDILLVPYREDMYLPAACGQIEYDFIMIPSYRFRPSSVPIHRKPYLSCIMARTELDDNPSSTEKCRKRKSLGTASKVTDISRKSIERTGLFIVVIFIFMQR